MATEVAACACLGAGPIVAKSAGVKYDLKPTTEVPWNRKQDGIRFQEAQYGTGMRLHNVRAVKGKVVGKTCTICGNRKNS